MEKWGLIKTLLLMHSRVSYNQITENAQKALPLLLDLLCLIYQRDFATFLAEQMSFSQPCISVWAWIPQPVSPDHPAGTIKEVH